MPSGNRPTRDPHTRPAINTLERLHSELGGQILENKRRHPTRAGNGYTVPVKPEISQLPMRSFCT
jgi:hypothetical protein